MIYVGWEKGLIWGNSNHRSRAKIGYSECPKEGSGVLEHIHSLFTIYSERFTLNEWNEYIKLMKDN